MVWRIRIPFPDLTIDPDAATATVTIVDDDVFEVSLSPECPGHC